MIFAALLLGLPIILLTNAWYRYLRLPSLPRAERIQMRLGLAGVSVASVTWLSAGFLMMFADTHEAAKSLASQVSPVWFADAGLPACLLAIATTGGRKQTMRLLEHLEIPRARQSSRATM